MRRHDRARLLAFLLCTASLTLLAPARAGESDLSVRIIQVKGIGSPREKDKTPELDKALEPLRTHLETLTYAKYALLDKETKRGPQGRPLAFKLQNKHKAEVTVTPDKAKRNSYEVTLRVTKTVTKDNEDKDEEVVKKTYYVVDGATDLLPPIVKAAGGDDLIIAVTASKDPL